MRTGLTLTQLAVEIERRAKAKDDFVVSTRDIEMIESLDLVIAGGDKVVGINKIAHDQIASHTEIPRAYYNRMLADDPRLLAANVNTWFRKNPVPRMVRCLDNTARALLSDRYRPLENEDLAEAVLPPIMEMGLDVMSSQITDQRLYIKAVDPKVTRELAAIGGKFGDGGHNILRMLAPAITISNSEVGQGALAILGGVYDGFCSNLATFGERSTRKYHVGSKHEIAGEDTYALLSDETRRKKDVATWAEVGDVVRAAFDRARFDSLCEKIEGTQKDKIEGDPVQVVKLTTSRFGLNESAGTSILRHLIEGGDLSRFGLYNAMTRAAQDVEDYDDATAMERQGAQIIELPKAEWKALAEAA
ncbi:MAG TPA: DUF932 domain-containing protein [Casimicrobiaceae bacterium]|jgi:hypothetical protein|nr:DUF932 domain-containing protein [Casimicrobiaceae bacterium]